MSQPQDLGPEDTAPTSSTVVRGRPRRWQVSLRTLVLLIAAVAVWTTEVVNRRENKRLEGRIEAIRPLVHELRGFDPRRIAVVKLEETWYDENRWDIYLPPGSYRVCLASRQIGQDVLAPVRASSPIGAGRHRIELTQEKGTQGWVIRARCDGRTIVSCQESMDWNPERGSSGGGQFAQVSAQDPDQPLILFRRVFSLPTASNQFTSPQEPSSGLLLWIEQLPTSGR